MFVTLLITDAHVNFLAVHDTTHLKFKVQKFQSHLLFRIEEFVVPYSLLVLSSKSNLLCFLSTV